METTICIDSAVTTLVNVFTVGPDNQSKVLALLQEGARAPAGGYRDHVQQEAWVDIDKPPQEQRRQPGCRLFTVAGRSGYRCLSPGSDVARTTAASRKALEQRVNKHWDPSAHGAVGLPAGSEAGLRWRQVGWPQFFAKLEQVLARTDPARIE